VRFLARDLEAALDATRLVLGTYLGADPADLVFVPNATHGVNTVLRSLPFAPGDELLTDDHEYNASVNALRAAAERTGARAVVAAVPFPIGGPDEVTAAILAAVEVLVDGAHAPGMLPLDLDALAAAGVSYYTGNRHKWLCAPKGSGFLWVRRDRQAAIGPLAVSHGANSARRDRGRFRVEFDWTGTADPTPYLAMAAAIDVMRGLLPGGWPALRAANHAAVVAARRVILERLGVAAPAPEAMLGSMAAILLPPPAHDGPASTATSPLDDDPLQVALREWWAIEVPIMPWPPTWSGQIGPQRRLVRISAQAYVAPAAWATLAGALATVLDVP
jgi:isopenicillin-N epimerase